MAEKSGKSARRQGYSCSFCGKSQEKVERLIAGPGGVYICNECIDLCNEILADGRAARANSSKGDQTPQARPGHWYQKKR